MSAPDATASLGWVTAVMAQSYASDVMKNFGTYMSGKRNWGDNMTHRNDGKEPPASLDGYIPLQKIPSKWWKSKYKCKKNKGDHTPVIEKIMYCGRHWRQEKDGTWIKERSWWGNPDQTYGWVLWVCTACHKHMTEHSVPDKKFDKYRDTIC